MLVDLRTTLFGALGGLLIGLCACADPVGDPAAAPATPTSPVTALPTAGPGGAAQPSPAIPSAGMESGACASCLMAHQLQQGVTARFILFYADNHAPQAVIDDVIEPLRRVYGDMVIMKSFAVNSPAGREWLARVEDRFQIAAQPADLPIIVIGERVLIGEAMIRQQLPGIIEVGLNRGGIDWPALPGVEAWNNSD